ncbi:fzlA [Symbiodinium necroappetens]|uniref:FzlA protein n=1 Tax=Symbiodinium necroappetens TaxID=1628268 RepID=A0A812T0X5_9DINO|nr:fzlA [Symbiodinium necroappetens]
MRTLYHLPLDPGCRKIRLLLHEKGVEVELKAEKTWERREQFLRLNPAGEVPVLVEADGSIIPDAWVLAEYLNDAYAEVGDDLMGQTPLDRAEVRRLVAWFDRKFAREVSDLLIEEKVMKRFLGVGTPDSSAIRAANQNIHYHLDYIGWLSDRRNWLAGDNLSLADFAAAAHLSCLDYLDCVPWDQHAGARDWYARIKSRPSMRPLLADLIPGFPPPAHYADLDF